MDERLTTLLGLAAMGDEDDDLEDDDEDNPAEAPATEK